MWPNSRSRSDGWVAVAAGVASIGAGLIQASVGKPSGASRVLTIIGPTVITAWLLVIGILLVQKGRERQTEHVATPGGPSGTGP